MNISSNIKKYRKAKKISQEKLASLLFVHQSYISRWEADKVLVPINMLERLSYVLDVPIKKLIFGEKFVSDPKTFKKLSYDLNVPITTLIQIQEKEEWTKLF